MAERSFTEKKLGSSLTKDIIRYLAVGSLVTGLLAGGYKLFLEDIQADQSVVCDPVAISRALGASRGRSHILVLAEMGIREITVQVNDENNRRLAERYVETTLNRFPATQEWPNVEVEVTGNQANSARLGQVLDYRSCEVAIPFNHNNPVFRP